MGSCEVLRAEVLNMRLQGQRLMDYVNTKWEEMIHDWRAVILKEQQHSYQHSVENEWMVTQHRHRVVRLSQWVYFPIRIGKCKSTWHFDCQVFSARL